MFEDEILCCQALAAAAYWVACKDWLPDNCLPVGVELCRSYWHTVRDRTAENVRLVRCLTRKITELDNISRTNDRPLPSSIANELQTLTRRAIRQESLKRYEEAEVLYNKAISVLDRETSSTWELAYLHVALSELNGMLSRTEEVIRHRYLATALFGDLYGSNSPRYAWELLVYSGILQELGLISESELELERVEKILTAGVGLTNYLYGHAALLLAEVSVYKGRGDSAEEYSQQADSVLRNWGLLRA